MCILIDVTGSMSAWIDAAKETAMRVAREVRAAHPAAGAYRLAVVGYRDYGDSARFEVQHFTSDVQAVETRLGGVEARGGDDAAEDVAGGLHQAASLDWRGDVRVMFHVADAPAHGSEYHGPTLSDRYPGGDPDGRDPKALMRQLAGAGVDYTFIRVTPHTDRMVEVLHAAFTAAAGGQPERFVVLDLAPQVAAAAEAAAAKRRAAYGGGGFRGGRGGIMPRHHVALASAAAPEGARLRGAALFAAPMAMPMMAKSAAAYDAGAMMGAEAYGAPPAAAPAAAAADESPVSAYFSAGLAATISRCVERRAAY